LVSEDQIILVDRHDTPLAPIDKLSAHLRPAKLHRAFSIFILNSQNQMLLQLRGRNKYHFGNLWTNACCSHPRWGEDLTTATHRRLLEETGFDTDLQKLFSFIYQADWNAEIAEHELDHVFLGRHDGPTPTPNAEADQWRWINLEDLQHELLKDPDRFTPWFKIALSKDLLAYCR
jgi:isopentenyl-diphosphate delta-isomerase